MANMKLGIISDTHGYLNPHVFEIFAGVDRIIHAGDVGDEEILTDLEAMAPLTAVTGNVDDPLVFRRLAAEAFVETPAGRIAVTHGHRESYAHRLEEMGRHFAPKKPAVIVFGHTHEPLLHYGHNVIFFNPGSAGKPRFTSMPHVGLIETVGRNGKESFQFQHLRLKYPWRGKP